MKDKEKVKETIINATYNNAVKVYEMEGLL